MELTHTDRNHGGFDLQDLALLVTFYDEIETDEGVFDCEGNLISPPSDPPADPTPDPDPDSGGDSGSDSGNIGNGNGNNGHGNNVDGVDMSNPGNSPHHADDTDPDVDDEKGNGRGRRKK